MNLATDRKHLTTQAYATEEHLATRIRTHKLYTQPKADFYAWVLDHIPWRGDERVLDIGCGSGGYIQPVTARLTNGGRLFSGELSAGMLNDATAKNLSGPFSLLNADAMTLPLPDACYDVAMANHMLYHVPHIERALAEIRRVLQPGGHFIAVTNASNSIQRLVDEIVAAVRALGYALDLPPSPVRVRFTTENGGSIIEPFFPNVERFMSNSALVFPSAAPVVDYINSLRHHYSPQLPRGLRWEALMEQIAHQIEGQIRERGEYRVSKTSGVFVAAKE